jgi:hypothetical protein
LEEELMCDERQVRGRGGGGNPGGFGFFALKTRDPFFKFIIFLI